MESEVKPLEWNGTIETGHLRMLDQRKLPHREEWLEMSTASQVADGIRSMVIRGAPAIGIAAAYGVFLAARNHIASEDGSLLNEIQAAYDELGEARPTAVNLKWALNRMHQKLERLEHTSRAKILNEIFDEADAIRAEDRSNNIDLATYGAELFDGDSKVLTHCNTGGLATGGIGTALGIIRAGFNNGKIKNVWVDETRPYLQGARLTTWECLKDGIPATLITDSMAAHFMARGEVDAVVVGTDRVAANGDIANKIGTYGLAVLCDTHDIPFYVGAPISTIDLETPSGDDIPIEERSKEEVTRVGAEQIAPDGIDVAHPAFDITPSRYIDAIVTESGVAEAPYSKTLEQLKTS